MTNQKLLTALAIWQVAVFQLQAQAPVNQETASQAATQLRVAVKPDLDILQPVDESTGRDIVLLRRHLPFYVRMDQRLNWTDNAFFSGTRVTDTYSTTSLAVGFETKTEGGLELTLEGVGAATRYNRNPGIDYNYYGGVVGVGYSIGKWRIKADYRPIQFDSRDFSNHLVFNHDYGVSVSSQGRLGRTTGWFVNLRLSRIDAAPSDYSAWRAAPHIGVYCQPRAWFLATTGVAASFTHYDHYFTGLTGQDRSDTLISPFLNLTVTPRPWLVIGASVQYANNDSSLRSSRYHGVTVTPSAQLRFRF